MDIIKKIEASVTRKGMPDIHPGDTVRVHTRLQEAGRQHLQIFEGIVIKLAGSSIRKTMTVRKNSYGVGVEKVFPFASPSVAKVEIVSRGQVRRSKLYYLRDLSGKKARLKGDRNFDATSSEPEVPAGA